MMYRLLKDLIDWKCNFYNKCKLGNFWFSVMPVLILLLSIECIQCSTSIDLKESSSNSARRKTPRTVFEHGIFRHDNVASPFPPKSDISGLTKDSVHHVPCHEGHGCQSESVSSIPPLDNKDRYTYERFKRSVTTLNFHPKPKKEQKKVVLKPMRIFKYITEDDVLVKPSKSERHITIFHPLMRSGTNGSNIGGSLNNDTNHQQVVGGAKVNLKAKLDKSNSGNSTSSNKVISNNGANNESDSESKPQIRVSTPPKPENIQIFKPSLAIRKNNKTSLIPSGNHFSNSKLSGNHITTSFNTVASHESTDPDSSSVNDRSLIHNLYFDSVVMLSEEGQKQLLHQQHQSVESHREETSGSDDEIKNMSATPSDTFTSSPTLPEPNKNATISKTRPKISPNLPTTNKEYVNANFTSAANDLVESLIQTINATITENKDNVIFKIKSPKNKKNKSNNKKKPSERLDEDDIGQDGSERSRRSPFRTPFQSQPNIQRSNSQHQTSPNGGQLARAALFRRTNVPRLRQNPRVMQPRVMTSVPIQRPGKPMIARTILPMRQMAMPTRLKQNTAFMHRPLGPGPVGPPIAAIKVMTLNNNNQQPLLQSSVPGKEQMPDASRTVYSYKPLPSDILLNQESSYSSPTYKRFKKKFQNQITSMMGSQRELEDGLRWEAEPSRYASRPISHSKARSRSSSRHHRHNHQARPRSRHHSQNRMSPRSKKLSGPKYTYPKNAQNIQDILKHFDKESPGFDDPGSIFDKAGGAASPNRQQSALPDRLSQHQHPKLADLSGEFRDVHASLLKDIKEFAKRPNLFGESSGHSSKSSNSPLSFHHFDSSNEAGLPPSTIHNDPFDEIFEHKKPGRDRGQIKPDLYSLENIRERIAYKRGKLHGRHRHNERDRNPGKYEDEEHKDKDISHHEDRLVDERRVDDRHVDEDDEFYDRPSRHNSEDTHSTEQMKSLFSKEDYDSPVSFSKKKKHKDSHQDDSHAIFPSSHYHREKDSQTQNSSPFGFHSTEFHRASPSPAKKPIVLKRPNEPYRVRDTEPKKKPEHDYFWNTFTNGFEKANSPTTYDTPMVIKSPTPPSLNSFSAYGPFGAAAATQALPKPISVEEEDIVEIHTGGGPPGAATGVPSFPVPDTQQMKQDKLQKMYMDVLHQKMQLEAALYRPQAAPSVGASTMVHHPQIMNHPQIYQHSQITHQPQISQHPQLGSQISMAQHSPYQIQRVPHQISSYPTQSTALSPFSTGLPGVRRKKPMRMKIHIYPNGNEGIEQGIEAANLLAAGGFGTSGFSASNPPGVVAPPPKDAGMKNSNRAIPSGQDSMQASSQGFNHHPSASGPIARSPGSGKNKNVVLHLHVHRRNDVMSPLELEAEGSNQHPITAKPELTYKEIFDEQMKSEQQNNDEQEERSRKPSSGHHNNHREEGLSNSAQDTQEREPHHDEETEREHDKSVSMEVPIHDEKIEDVFHSIMNLRNKPDNRRKRS